LAKVIFCVAFCDAIPLTDNTAKYHGTTTLLSTVVRHGHRQTDRLQRVLNAAARLVSGTRKYDRGLSRILHADLHWLDVAD